MGQTGHKVKDNRPNRKSRKRRSTNKRNSAIQACVNQSVTPNKNGKILTNQKENSDDEQRFAEDDHSSFVEVSSYEHEAPEMGNMSTMAEEASASLSIDGLKDAWFDSTQGEVTLGTDAEKKTPTRNDDEHQFQEIWSTNVDFSSIRCSFRISSASDEGSLVESIGANANKSQTIIEKDDDKVGSTSSCWVMEFEQKDNEDENMPGWIPSTVPNSDDFASDSANEKNCYFQFVGVDDDFKALPTMCFDNDCDVDKESLGSNAEISFTPEEETEENPSSMGISKICEERDKGETVQKSSFAEKCSDKTEDQRMVPRLDDTIESLDRSSSDTEASTEVDTEGGSPANSMVRRMCSTVKKMGFLSVFLRQWSKDVKKTIEEEDDDQRQKRKTFINPTEVLGTSPPSAGTFSMKTLVSTVLTEARSVEQDVHPYGRGNMYRNAFAGKRSLVQLDPAKLMFWGIVVCMITGIAFGVIILSEIHRGSLRRLLVRYNGSFPDWY